MSKKVYVLSVQPEEDGPVFGRVMDPTAIQSLQDYSHGHISQVVKDLLVAGAPGAQVAGFAATVAGGLDVSVATGAVVDANGISYESPDLASVVTLAAAHVTLPRIDLIVATLEVDAPAESELVAFRQLRTQTELEAGTDPYVPTQFNQPRELHTRATITVKTGVPNVAPAAPVAGVGEVPLWRVAVAAADTVLAGGDLTDVRVLMKSLYQVVEDVTALLAAIVNISETIDDRVAALVVDSTSIIKTYNDAAGTLQFSIVAEAIDDRVAALLADSTYFTKTYDDAGNLLTFDLDLTAVDARYVNSPGDTMSGRLKVSIGGGTDPGVAFNTGLHVDYNGGPGTAPKAVYGYGQAGLADGDSAWGGYFTSHANRAGSAVGTTSYGVFGTTDGGDTRHAGYFQGNVTITGSIAKGSGTFLIDHPLDPESKDLIHGFVEAPRYDLIYRGTIKLKKGVAIVDVDLASGMTPGTFAALVQNVQFQQPYNETGWRPVRVRPGSLEGGTFILECEDEKSADTIAWSLIAERRDDFIMTSEGTDDGGHLIVERDKDEPTGEELQPRVVDRNARQAAPDEEREEVAWELLGKRGHRRHMPDDQQPKRKVLVRTLDREGRSFGGHQGDEKPGTAAKPAATKEKGGKPRLKKEPGQES